MYNYKLGFITYEDLGQEINLAGINNIFTYR